MAILTVVDAHNEIARAAEVGGDEAIDILEGVEDPIHNWLMSEEEKRALIGGVHAMPGFRVKPAHCFSACCPIYV